MRDRFVRPELIKLALDEDDWILVRRRLSWGETRDLNGRRFMADPDTPGAFKLNPKTFIDALVTAYLVDWSFTREGEPVAIRALAVEELQAILDELEPDDLRAIRRAIEDHVEREEALREAEKKTPAGATGSPATSGSPGAAAGAMSGSGISIPTSIGS